MKRFRKEMSLILFCVAMSFLSSSCDSMQEEINKLNMSPPGQPYSWLTPEEKARQVERRGYDPSWDIMDMKWQRMVEESERRAREEELKTHLYIQGLRRRQQEQQMQRELNRLNQKRQNR